MASKEDLKVAHGIAFQAIVGYTGDVTDVNPIFMDRIRLVEDIATALTAARAEGEASMRERAAEVPKQHWAKYDDHHDHCMYKCLPEEIRALPLEAAAGSKTKDE